MLLTAMHVRAPDASDVGDVTHLYFHGSAPGKGLPFDLGKRSVEWVSEVWPGESVGGASTLLTQGNLVLAHLDVVAPDYVTGETIHGWVKDFFHSLKNRGAGSETRVVYEWPPQGNDRRYAVKGFGRLDQVQRLAPLLVQAHQIEAARWSRQATPITFWVARMPGRAVGVPGQTRIELGDDDRARLAALPGARSPVPHSYTVPEEAHAQLLRAQQFDALALDAVVGTLTGLSPAELLPLGGLSFQERGADRPFFVWPSRAPGQ